MNIGVLGGTFDPIHIGHLVLAEEVRSSLDLTEVLFLPAGQPWLKAGIAISPAQHRVEMVKRALNSKPYFKLDTMEIERAGPTYTVDTIAELRAHLKADDGLFFVLGWDNLAELPHWRDPSRLIGMCRMVAVPRPGYHVPDLKALEASIPGLSQRVTLMDKPEIDISSSEIRDKVARGLSVRRLVPGPVERYIRENRLYLEETQE